MSEKRLMRAVAKTKPGMGAELIWMPVPLPAPDEVLIKIRSCAICGTDVSRYYWRGMKNDPRARDAFPRVLGHEFCGTVVAMGNRVEGVQTGERVTSETHVPCGECFLCKSGNGHNCQNLHGFKNGVFSEYAVIPAKTLIKVPDTVSDEVAATLEPFSVAVHAMEYADVLGDTVLITGAGPIGLYAIQLAKAAGAARIYASDVSTFRRELAAAAGADVVLDPTQENVAERVVNETDGLGAGIVFETSGNATAFSGALDAIRKCGTLVVVGLPSAPMMIDVSKYIVHKSLHIHGVYGRSIFRSWERALQLLATGRVPVGDVITHRLQLMDEYEKGFALAAEGKSGKVVFCLD